MTPTFLSEIRRVSFCVDRPKYAEPAYFFRNSVKLAYKNLCLKRFKFHIPWSDRAEENAEEWKLKTQR